MIAIPDDLRYILFQTPELQQAYLVGGCVRDGLLGLPQEDVDIEVFGLGYDRLSAVLSQWGKADRVGRSFGVVKLTMPGGRVYDFSIPRRDSKIESGHKGFEVIFDPKINLEDAAFRRDFTINALMYDPRGNRIVDNFGGVKDLEKRILRHTSPAFVEDPLRVLRGMQLCARFDLVAAHETVSLCQHMKSSCGELSVERVCQEWLKWARKSRIPSRGLKFLSDTGWILHFPELAAIQGVPQDPEWHPEGDVWTHTCHCCDALVSSKDWQGADADTRAVLALSVLTHDLGKATVTQRKLRKDGWRIVSPGHEIESEKLAQGLLQRIGIPHRLRDRVAVLVRNHMVSANPVSEKSIRRLARRLHPETIQSLCVVMTADRMGRCNSSSPGQRSIEGILQKAQGLAVAHSEPKPILLGRHLLGFGIKPGPEMGRILAAAFEAQLDGIFSTLPGCYKWLSKERLVDIPSGSDDGIPGLLSSNNH